MECTVLVIDTFPLPITDQESGKSGNEEDHSHSNSATSLLSNGSSSALEEPVSKEMQKEGPKATEPSNTASLMNTDPEPNGESCGAVGIKGEERDNEREADEVVPPPTKPSGTLDSSFSSLPPSLAASLDPQQFKLEPPVLGKLHKITKESFENVGGGGLKKSDDPSDPFSGLDPLWSHKKPS